MIGVSFEKILILQKQIKLVRIALKDQEIISSGSNNNNIPNNIHIKNTINIADEKYFDWSSIFLFLGNTKTASYNPKDTYGMISTL